jgi:host factor-I protein
MAKQSINVQDGFLYQALKSGDGLAIELVTGRWLEGKLTRFDRFAVILQCQGKESLVYKHAIASIAPLSGGEG